MAALVTGAEEQPPVRALDDHAVRSTRSSAAVRSRASVGGRVERKPVVIPAEAAEGGAAGRAAHCDADARRKIQSEIGVRARRRQRAVGDPSFQPAVELAGCVLALRGRGNYDVLAEPGPMQRPSPWQYSEATAIHHGVVVMMSPNCSSCARRESPAKVIVTMCG